MSQRSKLRKPACLVMSCVCAAAALAGDPATISLKAAIDSLAGESSYGWTTIIEVPGENRSRRQSIKGRTEHGERTHAVTDYGGAALQIVIDGDIAAVTNRDGQWETVSLLDKSYRSAGFAASTANAVHVPVAEATTLVNSSKNMRQENGVFTGSLSEQQAAECFTLGRRADSPVCDAIGKVRIWTKDGQLFKYEVFTEGTITEDGEQKKTWRRSTTEVLGVGTSIPVIPDKAAIALSRPIPKPEPRLSDEKARQILERHGKRNISVHDPSSIVKCGEEYWVFSTGTGIPSWRSTDLIKWRRGPRVFPDIPAWITAVVPSQRGHFWAPDIIKCGGRYLLYYSVSSFGSNTSAIALASTPTLDPDNSRFHWTDHGIVIQTSQADDYNAIDPAIIETEAGELWMSFGSFWSGLKLLQLDPATGKRISGNSELYAIANYPEIEAPHICFHNGHYYLFVNWNKCCRGVESTYSIRVGRSRKIAGPYLDKDGIDLLSGGGTLLLDTDGPFIGPGHANIFREDDRYFFSCHYYDGTQEGRSMLSIRPMTWGADGWPTLADDRPAVRKTE